MAPKSIITCLFVLGLGMPQLEVRAWGFFGHRLINRQAIFMLPPEMMVLYKPNILFLEDHAVDADKRRYAVAEEGPRHYIDLDQYGQYPYPNLPRHWDSAVVRFGEDSLQQHGIVPWYIGWMLARLTKAFEEKNQQAILSLSADIGHYISDAHVPLHACSNHNGQHTNQHGIHGFWESRIPELFAQTEYDFWLGTATYLPAPSTFIWNRVLESAAAADTVLKMEARLTMSFPPDRKFAFEERQGKIVRQYSAAFSAAYQRALGGMIERRMRQSIFAVASFWYTAWVNAGKPDLKSLRQTAPDADALQAWEQLQLQWRSGNIKGREHEDQHP